MTAAADADRRIVLAREKPFRLGKVEVRPAKRELVGPGGREVLEPRVMQVLVALARADGEILTRDDLIERCWEGRVVGEDAITRVISRLRRAGEGVGRDGWSLETLTKVGYRLVPAGEDPEAGLRIVEAVSPTRPGRRAMLALGGAVGLAAAVTGGVVWLRRPNVPPQARTLYQKGVDAMEPGLPDDVLRAQGLLREAVTLAPDYAEAWGALALAYQDALRYTPAPRQPGVKAQAEAAARRALELDPDEARANAAVALLAPVWRNWSAAERLYDRALALHPHDPRVEFVYARLMLEVGRLKAAVPHALAGAQGDEFAFWPRHTLGKALWAAGRTEEAERLVDKALARSPRQYALWFLKFDMLAYTGRAEQAVAMGADVAGRPLNIPDEDVELHVGAARALASRAPADIRATVDANLAAAARGAGYAENALALVGALGMVDEAFRLADALFGHEGEVGGGQRFSTGRFTAAGRRQTHHLFMPPTASMRADPRFPPLMRTIGLSAYWRESGHAPDDPRWA